MLVVTGQKAKPGKLVCKVDGIVGQRLGQQQADRQRGDQVGRRLGIGHNQSAPEGTAVGASKTMLFELIKYRSPPDIITRQAVHNSRQVPGKNPRPPP